MAAYVDINSLELGRVSFETILQIINDAKSNKQICYRQLIGHKMLKNKNQLALNVIKLRIQIQFCIWVSFLCDKLIVKEGFSMIKQIKAHLNNSIQSIIGQKVEFVKQDEQAFTRKRSLSLETMIRTILGMGGKSLSKELLDAKLTVSNSAFVQRRYQIKPEAFYALFKEFTAPIPLNTDFPIFAADGSDICIPRNPMDTETSIQTQTDVKSYNLMHINALYDLTTGVYRDVFYSRQTCTT